FLHKPFDAMAIGTLMSVGGRSLMARHVVNALFALAIPLGAIMLHLGLSVEVTNQPALLGATLAFSAGMFICIALSDLLPELQFHQHDRLKLSAALLLGLALAWGVANLESQGHAHETQQSQRVIDPHVD
ncbi:MAG: ZIP family metal transporter, partial [Planctomycetota bacterium]|nr:ZIP family metal transporter [Planctomycetota bacterium]